MLIDGYGSIAADTTKAETAKQVASISAEKAAFSKGQIQAQAATTEDKTTFSSGAHTVQSLTQAAGVSSPSRQSKVEALKQAVSSAQYQLDSDKIAESLVNADV